MWEEDQVHPKPAPARHQIAPKLLLKILTQIGENPVNDTYPRGENFFKPKQGLLSACTRGSSVTRSSQSRLYRGIVYSIVKLDLFRPKFSQITEPTLRQGAIIAGCVFYKPIQCRKTDVSTNS